MRVVADDRRRRAAMALVVGAVALLLTLASLAVLTVTHRLGDIYGNELAIAVGLSGLGAVVASRAPDNPVGRLMLLGGCGDALWFATDSYVRLSGHRPSGLPLAPWVAWVSEWIWLVGFATLLHVLPLVFPDGRLTGGRWRPVLVAGLLGWVLLGLGIALTPGRLPDFPFANPLGGDRALAGALSLVGGLLALGGSVLATVSAVLRYRRARGLPRVQMQWYAAGAVVAVLVVVADVVLTVHGPVSVAVQFLAVLAVPSAIAVAVLRYRLYDIGRLVSRTVSYALLTALLAVPYLLVVPLASRLGGSNLGTAAATLLAAAAFRPLRSRVQAAVDRRFDRSRFDAQTAVTGYASRLRETVDLEQVSADLVGVVRGTLAPAGVSLWLRS